MDKYLLNDLMTVERKYRQEKVCGKKDEFDFGHVACEVPVDISGEEIFLTVLSSEKGFGQKLWSGKLRIQMVKEGKRWAEIILGRCVEEENF